MQRFHLKGFYAPVIFTAISTRAPKHAKVRKGLMRPIECAGQYKALNHNTPQQSRAYSRHFAFSHLNPYGSQSSYAATGSKFAANLAPPNTVPHRPASPSASPLRGAASARRPDEPKHTPNPKYKSEGLRPSPMRPLHLEQGIYRGHSQGRNRLRNQGLNRLRNQGLNQGLGNNPT